MPRGSDRLFVNCQTEPRHWKNSQAQLRILLSVIRQRNNTTCTAEKALLQNGQSSSVYIWVSIDKPSLSLLTEGYMSWQVSGDRAAQTENIFVAVSANRPFCFLMSPNISFVKQASRLQLAQVWRVTYLQNISMDYLYVPSSGKQSIQAFFNQNRSGKKLHQTAAVQYETTEQIDGSSYHVNGPTPSGNYQGCLSILNILHPHSQITKGVNIIVSNIISQSLCKQKDNKHS